MIAFRRPFLQVWTGAHCHRFRFDAPRGTSRVGRGRASCSANWRALRLTLRRKRRRRNEHVQAGHEARTSVHTRPQKIHTRLCRSSLLWR